MPRDASGLFQRLFRWRDDRDAKVQIRADRMDQEMDAIAQDLNDISAGAVAFRGPLKGLNGTAALPSYTFDEDQDTGLYRKGSDELALSVGGIEVIAVSQNVATITAETAVKIIIGGQNVFTIGENGAANSDELATQRDIWAIGDMKPTDQGTLKAGWILGEGQELSRETYDEYFALVGETFGGGDGSTTFNAPDFTQGDTDGVTLIQATASRPLRSFGGAATHQLTTDELARHDHITEIAPTSDTDGSGRPYGIGYQNGDPDDPNDTTYPIYGKTSDTGGDQSHNNMQPYFACNIAIFVGA